MGDVTPIRQAYRFALAPSGGQEALLASFTGASRFWFNQGLAVVKERLDARARGEDVRVPWSYKALCSEVKGDDVKDELAPWRSQVPIGSYQAGLEALGRALQNFSQGRRAGRQVGFPRFRSKGGCPESVIFQRPRIKGARQVEFDRRLGPVRTKEGMSKLVRLLERDEHAGRLGHHPPRSSHLVLRGVAVLAGSTAVWNPDREGTVSPCSVAWVSRRRSCCSRSYAFSAGSAECRAPAAGV